MSTAARAPHTIRCMINDDDGDDDDVDDVDEDDGGGDGDDVVGDDDDDDDDDDDADDDGDRHHHHGRFHDHGSQDCDHDHECRERGSDFQGQIGGHLRGQLGLVILTS